MRVTRNTRGIGLLVACGFVAALVACGNDPVQVAESPGTDGGNVDAAGDVQADGAGLSDADATTRDVVPEIDVDDIGAPPDGDAGPDECTAVGCECEADDECESGICISPEFNGYCSDICTLGLDECGSDLECVSVVDSDGVASPICIRPPVPSCQSCADSPCAVSGLVCVALVDGDACLEPCLLDDLCVEGFRCNVRDGEAVCLPLEQACDACFDQDEDGFGLGASCDGGADCDNTESGVYPGADEICDGVDNDCDGEIDEGFDLLTDAQNCGGCNAICAADEATSLCDDGVCVVSACSDGFADCDRAHANGCEVDLSEPDRCGGCVQLGNVSGTACGACREGVWTCTDVDEQECVGDPGNDRLNACGGCESLEYAPGTDCGVCGDGVGGCDPGNESTTCVGARELNSCGGCVDLLYEPGALCDDPCLVAECGDGSAEGAVVCVANAVDECLPLSPVAGLQASDGSDADFVNVTWTPSVGATSYTILRDGEEIGEVSAPGFIDAGADPGGTAAVRSLAEVESEPDELVLRWLPPTPIDGPLHVYAVVASNYTDRSEETYDIGYRGGEAVTRYRVERDGDAVTVADTEFVDPSGRPVGELLSATLTASRARWADRVELQVTDEVYDTTPIAVQVSAIYSGGDGPTAEITVTPVPAAVLDYAWERSEAAEPDSEWTPLATTTTSSFDDRSIPLDADLPFYFRASLRTEAETITTNVAAGFILFGSPWMQVESGGNHSCARRLDGTVRCWGLNRVGQLGIGSNRNIGDNEPVSDDSNVPLTGAAIDIGVGFMHACALLEDRTVHCWGSNDAGQLGIDSRDSVGITLEGLPPRAALLGGQAVVSLAVGYNHNCALMQDRSVRCWGSSRFGQLGRADDQPVGVSPGSMPPRATWFATDGVVQLVSDGTNQTCVMRENQRVYCWGLNTYGELGAWTTDPVSLTTPARSMPSVAAVNFSVSKILSPQCVMRVDDNATFCWGQSRFGQLGQGNTEAIGDQPGEYAVQPQFSFTPVTITNRTTVLCAIDGTGRVQCFGGISMHGIGYGTTALRGNLPEHLPGVDLDLGGPARSVSIGGQFLCALMVDNTIRCWGSDRDGTLGNGLPITSIGDAPGEMPPPPVQF
jgi:alpha-tubulin suppressor-like RCC1 family protein